MLKTTKQQKTWWANRKIDWTKHYSSTWSHPHRDIIVQALKSFNWFSLWEVGCASGPNLLRIIKELPDRQVGGNDVNADAIEVARSTFTNGRFRVESVEDLLLSDSACDVILSDATLIYVDPFKIRKVLHELTRVARTHILLCEFHSRSLWKRWLFRLKTGYNAYDYQSLLEREGAYDIQLVKIPPEYWPGSQKGDGWYDFGYVILAKLPNK